MTFEKRLCLKELFIRKVKGLISIDPYDYSLNESSPEFCVHLLKNISNLKLLKKLIVKFKESSNDWIKEFIDDYKGLFTILDIIEKYSSKRRASQRNSTIIFDSITLTKCICCIKELLNTKTGMESLIELVNDNALAIKTISKGFSQVFVTVFCPFFSILTFFQF
jgi:hypothetical protein